MCPSHVLTSTAGASARSELRTATHTIHQRLEARGQLASPALTRQSYVEALHGMLVAYTALETQLDAHSSGLARLGLSWPNHRKVEWIRADLATLGGTRTRVCDASSPIVRTLADALGCMYVMEGATLGGAIITRNVRTVLQLDTSTAFFASYGDAVGARWKQFCSALELGLSDAASRCEATRSAVATFAWIETCLIEGELRK